MSSQAYNEYQRVRTLLAFNVKHPEGGRRVLNQHAVAYTFEDKSVLKIHRSGFATATNTSGLVVVIGECRATGGFRIKH